MLSLKTLMIIAIGTFFLMSVYGFWLRKKYPAAGGPSFFVFFSLSFLSAMLFLGLRNLIPDFISIVIGNTAIALGYLFIYLALRAAVGLEAEWKKRYYVPVAVIFTGFLIFTYLVYDINMRIFISSLFFTLYNTLFAWMLWKHPGEADGFLQRVTAALFAVGALLFAARSFAANTIYLPANYLSSQELYILLPYYYLVVMCSSLALFFHQYAQRSQSVQG